MAHAGLGTGWDCIFANDFSAMKAAIYADNWGSKALVIHDIATLQISQLPGKADMAWASFPCQDLSLAGDRAGLDGERSGMFWPFMELMTGLKSQGRHPKVIALENVAGAITSHNGKDFTAMIESLCTLGYRTGALLIDAVHFLPQSRPRLFIVAVEDSIQIPYQCCADTPSPAWHPVSIIKAHNSLNKKIKEQWVWWSLPMPKKRLKTLDEIVEVIPQGVDWHTAAETANLLQMMSPVNRQKVIQAQGSGQLKVGTIYKRTRNGIQRAEVRFDGIAGCLRTPGGGSSRQTLMIVDGAAIKSRLLSPREAARLMGLKDSYKLPSKYNDAYHLAGDGVAVPVVSHLAKHLIGVLVDSAALQQSKVKVA